MSTFSGISTALSSLIAQRTALDVAGQNVANANTDGYTRQRATLGAVSTVQVASMFSTSDGIGSGVQVNGISRADDPFLDTKLRTQTSGASYLAARAAAYSTLESGLGEPGDNGLSAQLQTFWNDWHDAANSTNTVAARSNLLNDARQLTDMIKDQYDNVATQWADARTTTSSLVDQVNALGANVTDLNKRILDITVAGGSANELADQRDQALTQLAGLVGATAQTRENGEVDVYVGGNALVFGGSSHALAVAGAQAFNQVTGYATDGTSITPQDVHLEWADSPGQRVVPTGGTVAGQLTILAPAAADDAGTGGILAEAAQRNDAEGVRHGAGDYAATSSPRRSRPCWQRKKRRRWRSRPRPTIPPMTTGRPSSRRDCGSARQPSQRPMRRCSIAARAATSRAIAPSVACARPTSSPSSPPPPSNSGRCCPITRRRPQGPRGNACPALIAP